MSVYDDKVLGVVHALHVPSIVQRIFEKRIYDASDYHNDKGVIERLNIEICT